MTTTSTQEPLLKGAEEYRQSLDDGREVYLRGQQIDVLTHPATAGGIEMIAQLYEDQTKSETQPLLTYRREDGSRVTAAFQIPRTRADLRSRRLGIEHVARRTFGTHGRGMDMVAAIFIGVLAEHPTFKRESPEFADNAFAYRDYAERENIHLAETIIDPQGYRPRPSGTSTVTPPPERATMRVVRETGDGVWLSGVKGVGTAAAQANELLVGNFHPALPDESFWCVVSVGGEGVRLYCREPVHVADASPASHPIESKGEEMESIVAFDEVFVPRDRIFSLRAPALHSVNFYNRWGARGHWYTLVRLTAKAEMLAGLAQLIVDTLELGDVPVVRQRVAEILEFSQILRGMTIAAEETAEPTEGDVMLPNINIVTAGRSYALGRYPWVLHTIQDLCGQGLIFRFDDRDLASAAAFGKPLSWFLDTRSVSAQDKNRVMNLAWDLCSSSHANRVKLFEESNALNAPLLHERLYGEVDRAAWVNACRRWIGLETTDAGYDPHIVPALSAHAR